MDYRERLVGDGCRTARSAPLQHRHLHLLLGGDEPEGTRTARPWCNGYLDLTDVKQMNFTPTEQRVFSLKPGDVLVTEGSGSLSAVGASAVWNDEIEGLSVSAHPASASTAPGYARSILGLVVPVRRIARDIVRVQ